MRPTAALFSINVRRNVQLTTKQTGKGYYKGTGVKNLGSWDKLVPRKWIPDYNKIRTYVYPVTGIQDCQVWAQIDGQKFYAHLVLVDTLCG
jgi:large subunit ribosomal protein L41